MQHEKAMSIIKKGCKKCGNQELGMSKIKDDTYVEICTECTDVKTYWVCPRCQNYSEYQKKFRVVQGGKNWAITEESRQCLNCMRWENETKTTHTGL